MCRRKAAFGYQIRRGEYTICEAEAIQVRRAYGLYLAGASFAGIADTFTGERVQYSEDTCEWNKHLIKRMLQNARYAGKDDFPVIVAPELYREVQRVIRQKTEQYQRKTDEWKPLLKYLTCGCCGKTLLRAGGTQSRIYLQCKPCGKTWKVSRRLLLDTLFYQLNQSPGPEQTAFAASDALIRLNNAINRSMERPDKPEEIIDLILQAASERFRCCREIKAERPAIHTLSEIHWKWFGQTVSEISIQADDQIHIIFRQ